MALSRKDRSKVTKIILKVLQERDPQNASEAYAQKLVQQMQIVAKSVLAEKGI